MRIVHVMLTKRFAGTERHVVELTSAQVASGHEVVLVLRRKAARDRVGGIAHRVDRGVRIEFVADWIARWPAVARARQVARRLRPDIVHAHLGMACRALRGLDDVAPRVATLHLNYDPVQHDHFDGLVAIAPWQLSTLPESLRQRSVQIDNWTRESTASPGAREALRAQIGIGPDEFLFGAVGRIEASKGMDLLVDAFERAALPGARLAIVGDGREWQRLRRQAAESVAMPGFSEHPENWLAAFDCFVSPAREEPFGLVLLEAMQAQLPIVATATAGARHLANRIGRPLSPVGDVQALADGLAATHAQRPGRTRYDLRDYRVEVKARELETYYLRLIQRHAGACPPISA